jgi:hypothetical protein
MTSLDYARDTQATGLDQIARIALWARESAKIVDSPYAPTFRPIVTPTPTARIEDDVGEAADA